MNISKMMTLSMEHIMPETQRELLKEPEANLFGLSVYRNPYGFFIYVSSEEYDSENLTEDLKDCLKHARAFGCQWICLDADEPLTDDLVVYNWVE